MYYVYSMLYVAKYCIVRVYMALYVVCTRAHYTTVALSTSRGFFVAFSTRHDMYILHTSRFT